MLTRHKPRSRRSLYAFRAAIIVFGLYFSFHAFHGDHGLLAFAQVQARVITLEADRAALDERKQALVLRVQAMRSNALDGDLVDERARQTLGVIGPNDRILIR